jgi:hypothetical protein
LYIATLLPPTWILELEYVKFKRVKYFGAENKTSDRIDLGTYDLANLNLSDENLPALTSEIQVKLQLFFLFYRLFLFDF